MLDLDRSEARLPRWMILIAAAGTAGLSLAGHLRGGLGFAIGSFFGILNYRWLHESVEALANAGVVRPPKGVIIKFLVRYPLAILGLYGIYRTRWLPFMAVVSGLFVPAGAILIEAPFLIRDGLRNTGRDQ